MLKKLLLTSGAVLTLSDSVLAVDPSHHAVLPQSTVVTRSPVFLWTGFYFGASGGRTFNNDSNVNTVGTLQGNIDAVAANARPSTLKLETEGSMIGGTIGFNVQVQNFVGGVEGDFSYMGADKTVAHLNSVPFGDNAPGTLRNTFRQEMGYFATARGRAGIAFGRLLVYGTAGAAIADVKHTVDFSSPTLGPTQFSGRRNEVGVGHVVGGGVEWAFPFSSLLGGRPFKVDYNAVTLKTEYLYYDLSRTAVSVVPTATGVPLGVGDFESRFENQGHLIRAGINVKFGTF